MSNKGFTLAEVLVTLAVIGVVAALTIPTLMHNIEYAKYRAGAKEAYSIVKQAMTIAKSDNYDSFRNIFSTSNNAKETLKSYFNYTKECDAGASDGNCWVNSNDDKFLNGSGMGLADNAGFILNNGMFVRFLATGSACTNITYYQNPDTGEGVCGMIQIDTNGFKGPNVAGKDILIAFPLKDRIIPAGVKGSKGFYNNCSIYGLGCLAKYLDGTL